MNPSGQLGPSLNFDPHINHEYPYQQEHKEVQKLINEKYYKSNQMLDLFDCKYNWHLVLKYKDWSMIRQLGLTNCSISKNQKMSILISKPWPKLLQLILSDNKIGWKGIKLLIKTQFPELQDLWLFSCDIGNEGLKILTKTNWSKLRMLHLSDNKIGIDGYFSLSGHNWKQIKQVRATQNQNDPIVLFGFGGQVSGSLEKILLTIKNNQIDSDLIPIVESILRK